MQLRRPRVSARFRDVRSWVAFSDLHLTASSQSVAMAVLDRVHAEAVARDAGVIFLGDFWHHRGKIPVEPLNAAVDKLSSWRCPTIMLTGNHDQVTIGGEVHALTALAAAAPRGMVQVVAEPTLLLGALWLPYRRHQDEISQAIALAEREASRRGDQLRTIFCHADIQGAQFNSTYQATLGLPLSVFPGGTAVWSGHYHVPQVMQGGDDQTPVRVEYVGSPIELSFAEENQQKRLLLFSSPANANQSREVASRNRQPLLAGRPTNIGAPGEYEGWKRTGEVPLHIGPRHFSIEGETLAQWLPSDSQTQYEAGSLDAALAAIESVAGQSRPRGGPVSGDRVRIYLDAPASVKTETACELAVDGLRSSGVAVQIIRRPIPTPARIEGSSTMSPHSLLDAYYNARNQSRNSSVDLRDADYSQTAQAMLEDAGRSIPTIPHLERPAMHIAFDRVVICGFGPFLNEVRSCMA